MADDLPLVLWDCAYPEEAGLNWIQGDSRAASASESPTESKAYLDMRQHTEETRIKSVISEHFMQSYLDTSTLATSNEDDQVMNKAKDTLIQLGAGRTANQGKYLALLERSRSETAHVVNQRWMEGQGKRRAEKRAKKNQEGA